MNFGDYIKNKRLTNKYTMKDVADKLGLSISYLSDVEKGRRNPFEFEKLVLLSEILHLSDIEKNELMNLAGSKRNEIAPDVNEYAASNQYITDALRTSKNINASEQEWLEFIDKMRERNRGDK